MSLGGEIVNQHQFGTDEYDVNFTEEEERMLVALLNQYNAQLNDGIDGATCHTTLARSNAHQLPVHERKPVAPSHAPRPAQQHSHQQQQQQQQHQPYSSQHSESSLSLLSFASSAALEELLDQAAFPAEVVGVYAQAQALPAEPRGKAPDGASNATDDAPDVATNLISGQVIESGEIEPATPSSSSSESSIPPLQRWRSFKPLSVTDLVSPAWCELQYSLSLTHHGRKKRTPAMQSGSEVHQKLEEEVHAIFKVSVMSREDAWALRLWNIIQGARTLRETGLTRELQVWGVTQGKLVSGVIDELSYTCHDKVLEQQVSDFEAEDAGQQTIEQFFQSQRERSHGGRHRSKEEEHLKAYITDIKTRGSHKLPQETAFRPTEMQLMLYHRLLEDLVAAEFDPQRLWTQYSVDPDAQFSEDFIKQFASDDEPAVAEKDSVPMQDAQSRGSWPQQEPSSLPSTLHTASSPILGNSRDNAMETSDPNSQATEPTRLTESLEDLHGLMSENNSLRKLWDRMLAELSTALPSGLGSVLTAEYRSRDEDRSLLGRKTFLVDRNKLDEYLGRTMEWWDGKRQAVGVEIEEAWKCGMCEFADGCEWRQNKVDEALKRSRQKAKNPTERRTAKVG